MIKKETGTNEVEDVSSEQYCFTFHQEEQDSRNSSDNLVCGIDESGRGAAIGPIVTCGLTIPESKIKEVREYLGQRDSKDLYSVRRIYLSRKMRKKFAVDPYFEITRAPDMGNSADTEQKVSEKHAISLVKHIDADRFEIDQITPEAFPNTDIKEKVRKYYKQSDESFSFQVAEKADKACPAVMAASIFAAVKRDELINQIKDKFNDYGIYQDFGSGYSDDDRTDNFIEEYAKFPKVRRFLRSEIEYVI